MSISGTSSATPFNLVWNLNRGQPFGGVPINNCISTQTRRAVRFRQIVLCRHHTVTGGFLSGCRPGGWSWPSLTQPSSLAEETRVSRWCGPRYEPGAFRPVVRPRQVSTSRRGEARCSAGLPAWDKIVMRGFFTCLTHEARGLATGDVCDPGHTKVRWVTR
jgi:hypothetical protein